MRTIYAVLIISSIFAASQSACSRWSGGSSTTDSATESVPQYPDAATALAEGNKLLDANKTEMAIEAFKQAVAMDPNLAEAYFQLGVAYALVEMGVEEARKEDVNANFTSTKEVKTESQKAFEAAIEAYKKIIASNPNDADAHFNLGRAYAKLDKDSQAEREIREAMRLNPDENEYRVELGDVLMKLAKYSEAIAVYTKAREVDPENFDLDEKIEDAIAGRKRQTFTGPSPSPSPSPEETATTGDPEAPAQEKTPEPVKGPIKK